MTAVRHGRSRQPRVVVIGDVVLDRDIDGQTERIAPDAPVPVVDVTSTLESPGGAGLTAVLVARSGLPTHLVAPLADDAPGQVLAAALAREVELLALPAEGGTRCKIRVRSGGQSLVRIDEGGPGTPRAVPVDAVRAVLDAADVVVVSDYGAGVTHDPDLRRLIAEAARHRPVLWDPHPRGGDPVPGVALVTPNVAEARRALAALGPQAAGPDADAPGAADAAPDVLADRLRVAWGARAVCVTAGAEGAFLADGGEPLFVPAVPIAGGDPCGAGDRFVASVAVALSGRALTSEAVAAGVLDASAWVAEGGADGFRRRAADGAGPAHPPSGATGLEVRSLAARLRGGGRTLVATGGCFDIVHAGHVATLQAARRLGDALVVLLNSDDSVRRLKGPGRPVVTAADRARVLEAFDCVDAVVVFDEDDPRAVLEELRPDVWAKGGDYGAAPLPEAEVVQRHGGRVVLLPYLGGRSTTSIIERTGTARTSTARTGTARTGTARTGSAPS